MHLLRQVYPNLPKAFSTGFRGHQLQMWSSFAIFVLFGPCLSVFSFFFLMTGNSWFGVDRSRTSGPSEILFTNMATHSQDWYTTYGLWSGDPSPSLTMPFPDFCPGREASRPSQTYRAPSLPINACLFLPFWWLAFKFPLESSD